MRKVILTCDASGAALAGETGFIVVVVDVIDFSTSMEAAMDCGAAAIFGAGTESSNPPVKIQPYEIGRMAGREAKRLGSELIIVAEPRIGGDEVRKKEITGVINGIDSTGSVISGIIPNIGAEIVKLSDFNGKVVVGASGTGGVAFDAAVSAGAPLVLTGTVARTMKKNGFSSAKDSAERAVKSSMKAGRGIAVVAASGSSLEDLLAAEYIYKEILIRIR
ncbi:MAG: hypothetical protein ACOY46_10910 [Bacillota bacterium]